MEQSSPFVQYQHFQLSKLPRSDVDKNATRNRSRDNCRKVKANVELGSAFCGKASLQRLSSSASSTQSTRFESHGTVCRETCRWELKGNTPYFRKSSALERGDFKSKGTGKWSIHFCGNNETIKVDSSHDQLRQSASVSTEQ